MRKLMIPVVIAALSLSCSAAFAQDLADERARVVQQIGDVDEDDIDLSPLLSSIGLVYTHDVNKPGVDSLRFHFVIDTPGEGWTLQIEDESGAVAWEVGESEFTDSDFWSPEIGGERVTVNVLSSISSNALQLRINRVVTGARKSTPVSITGVNQLSSIVDQDDWIVDLGRSVTRLRIVGDFGGVYVCTAFLVTADIMLTNQHCIASEPEMKSTTVDFDFDKPGPPPETGKLSALLATDFALDYAVVRLETPVTRPPLQLNYANPGDGEQLLIIQHPGGEPKQISLADCKVDGTLVSGRAKTMTDFGHQCDTKGGSSGSPVLDFDGRSVVGLHHLGIADGSSNLFNRASHINLVLDDMPEDVRNEIMQCPQTSGASSP